MSGASQSGRGMLWIRVLKFNTVGAVGVGVQLLALAVYGELFGLNYLVATALAVETAVLHNFVWHERWTWREQTRSTPEGRYVALRLLRFHLANGLVSIVTNLVLMRLLTGYLGWNYLIANPLAIASAAVVNFLLSDRFVFATDIG